MTALIIILAIIAWATLTAIAVKALRRVLYAREVHHLHKVTEWQARENCAPLSHAIVERRAVDD